MKLYCAALILCCLKCCATPDPSDIAVDVISYLEPVLRLLLSAEDLLRWNESVTEQPHPMYMCIDNEVKELFTSSTQPTDVSECIAFLEELFDYELLTTSGGSTDRTGGDDDAETFSVSALSKVFCNKACSNLLLLAYGTCGILMGKQLNDILCRNTSKDELCMEVLVGPSFPTALSNCTTENGCDESCKQGLDQVSHDIGCCLHFAVGSALAEQCTLPKCEGTDSIRDTSVVTGSDTLTSVLSVCFVLVMYV